MSDWHRNWQEKFSAENREVIIKPTFSKDDFFILGYNLKAGVEYTHRVDVVVKNYVVEFQRPKISNNEFELRNYFYVQAGYKVVWVFDFVDEYKINKIQCYDEYENKYGSGGKFS